MTQTTKRALAASLKTLLETKPLDKITVTDVAEDCGVNRQTFYYHFQDIYDLVEWIFLSEAEGVIGENRTRDTWQEGYLGLFTYLRENRHLVLNTYHSINRDQLENFLYKATFDLLAGVVEECAAGLSVREEDRAFVTHFYKYAFVGLVLDWLREGMKGDPAALVGRLNTLIQGDVRRGLEKLSAG